MSHLSPDTFAAFDDTSPNFRYDIPSLWGHLQNAPMAFNNTISYTKTIANLTISFSGSRALLSGVIGDSSDYGNPSINVYLDGRLDNWGTAPNVSTHVYNQTFYSTGVIPDGDHTLVVENVTNGTILFIDALYFVPSSSLTGSPTLVTVTATQPVIATDRSISSHAPSSSNHVSTGAIVGGVVGGITLLIAIILVIFLCRYRRRRRHGLSLYHYKQVDPSNLHASDIIYKSPQTIPPPPSVRPYHLHTSSFTVPSSGHDRHKGSSFSQLSAPELDIPVRESPPPTSKFRRLYLPETFAPSTTASSTSSGTPRFPRLSPPANSSWSKHSPQAFPSPQFNSAGA